MGFFIHNLHQQLEQLQHKQFPLSRTITDAVLRTSIFHRRLHEAKEESSWTDCPQQCFLDEQRSMGARRGAREDAVEREHEWYSARDDPLSHTVHWYLRRDFLRRQSRNVVLDEQRLSDWRDPHTGCRCPNF